MFISFFFFASQAPEEQHPVSAIITRTFIQLYTVSLDIAAIIFFHCQKDKLYHGITFSSLPGQLPLPGKVFFHPLQNCLRICKLFIFIFS